MLKEIVVTLLLLGCVFAGSARPHFKHNVRTPTRILERNGRIMGGRNATIEEHPYIVAVYYHDYQLCGGTIINRNTVLTAAQCTDERERFVFTVRAGSTSRSSGGQFIVVSRYFEHELYDEFELKYDVAILKLSRNLVFSASVRPIPLPPFNFHVPHDSIATVSGWGVLVIRSGIYPDNLQSVQLPIVENKQCGEFFEDEIYRHHICAGDPSHNALPGDTGGPLTYQGYVVGVLSWGFGYDIDTPTVYVRVSEVLPFIRRHM